MTNKQLAMAKTLGIVATMIGVGILMSVMLTIFTLEQIGIGFSVLFLIFAIKMIYELELVKLESTEKLNDLYNKKG